MTLRTKLRNFCDNPSQVIIVLCVFLGIFLFMGLSGICFPKSNSSSNKPSVQARFSKENLKGGSLYLLKDHVTDTEYLVNFRGGIIKLEKKVTEQ